MPAAPIMPYHTSSLSSSHTLSSTLRRKTLSRLLSASHISTQKGLSCPRETRYPASQPIPITSRPIQFPPTNPEAPIKSNIANSALHGSSGPALPCRSQHQSRAYRLELVFRNRFHHPLRWRHGVSEKMAQRGQWSVDSRSAITPLRVLRGFATRCGQVIWDESTAQGRTVWQIRATVLRRRARKCYASSAPP